MMRPIDRRSFLAGGAAAALLGQLRVPAAAAVEREQPRPDRRQDFNTAVDFRFAPDDFQSTICFPDDPAKTVIGKHGDLRYDFPRDVLAATGQFGTVIDFEFAGMRAGAWRDQTMEAPGIPIVHTHIELPAATLELIAFASDRANEGRVDNVLLEIRACGKDAAVAAPVVRIRSARSYRAQTNDKGITEVFREAEKSPAIICIPQNSHTGEAQWRLEEGAYLLTLEHGTATHDRPLRYFFRLPQSGDAGHVETSIDPDALLNEVRAWWREWHEFGGAVQWSMPGPRGGFLTACARNIQQAREIKQGALVFEVGPTMYRGLWIVDGNFLLEAARYLGFDDAADQGLLSEWKQQLSTGQIVASGGKEHWKDTAIALFTLIRACELKQDWSLLRQLAPNAGHAIEFLIGLRDEARKGDSPNGRYGLLAPGFPDGGIAGIRYDFTNTVWALAGLKAVVKANEKLHLPDLERAAGFYRELRSAFDRAAASEVVSDPRGFRYLPMLMREDSETHRDEWNRPRPQSAQWALSHAIFPGQVFAKDDPIVRGHIALMQACTQEDVPAETGWLRHEGVWNYNAAFVAEVYLWAGVRDWAHRTFTGYLNHASPLHAWREEQPLQTALIGQFWGDMPHNWASAECIRYLRHVLVLEDDQHLRLLDGLMPCDLAGRQPYLVQNTPTRFGRVSLAVEPEGTRGWKVHFVRHGGAEPDQLSVPILLGSARFKRIEGAAQQNAADEIVSLDPRAGEWTAYWD